MSTWLEYQFFFRSDYSSTTTSDARLGIVKAVTYKWVHSPNESTFQYLGTYTALIISFYLVSSGWFIFFLWCYFYYYLFQIGKGQFSVVYRATCKVDVKIVALKKVQIFEMMDAKSRLDCMKEIQLLQVGARKWILDSYQVTYFLRWVFWEKKIILAHQAALYRNKRFVLNLIL